jgi:hypothetical protein
VRVCTFARCSREFMNRNEQLTKVESLLLGQEDVLVAILDGSPSWSRLDRWGETCDQEP